MFYSCVSVTPSNSNIILPVAWLFCNFLVFLTREPLVISPMQRHLYQTTHNTHKRQPCMSLAGLETTFPATVQPTFLQYWISDRELVNRMIPDGVLPDDEHFWSLFTHLLLLWSCCLRFLILRRSAQTTSGTDSALTPEITQLRNFQYMFTALLCRQDAIKK